MPLFVRPLSAPCRLHHINFHILRLFTVTHIIYQCFTHRVDKSKCFVLEAIVTFILQSLSLEREILHVPVGEPQSVMRIEDDRVQKGREHVETRSRNSMLNLSRFKRSSVCVSVVLRVSKRLYLMVVEAIKQSSPKMICPPTISHFCYLTKTLSEKHYREHLAWD